MPTIMITVARVTPRQVRFGDGWRTKYDLIAAREPGTSFAPAFKTWNADWACLASRAREMGRKVTLGYRQTEYGSEIASLRMEPVEKPI